MRHNMARGARQPDGDYLPPVRAEYDATLFQFDHRSNAIAALGQLATATSVTKARVAKLHAAD